MNHVRDPNNTLGSRYQSKPKMLDVFAHTVPATRPIVRRGKPNVIVFHISVSRVSSEGKLSKRGPNAFFFNCLSCVRYIMLSTKETVKEAYPRNIGIMCANSQNVFKLYVSARSFLTSATDAIENPVTIGITNGVSDWSLYKNLSITESKTMRER